MALNFLSDWRTMFETSMGVLSHPDPVFYSRIGGSDTDAIKGGFNK